MKVTMFQDRFAESVRNGTKLNTIRSKSASNPKVGEWRSLRRWTGKARRSKQEVLREAEIVSVYSIQISPTGVFYYDLNPACTLLAKYELNHFARQDGFKDWADMVQWFEANHGLPFDGVLISWNV